MKFILAAAILASAFAQQTSIGTRQAQDPLAHPIRKTQPVQDKHPKDIIIQKEDIRTDNLHNEDKNIASDRDQKGNMRIDEENVEQNKEKKKQVSPMFGEEQFNPSEFKHPRPGKFQQNSDSFPHPPKQGRSGDAKPREGPHGRPHPPPIPSDFRNQAVPGTPSDWKGPQNWDGPRKHYGPGRDQMKSHQSNRQPRIQGFSPQKYEQNESEQNFRGGWGKGQHKKNKKLYFTFFITAVIFTIFGLCLGKCARKCKKNRKQRIKHLIMRSRTSAQIYQEIQETERKANELKNQYRNKKSEEERVAHEFRRQEEVNFQYETQMRNVHYPQRHPQVFYAQQPYQVPRATIPVGRPLNESNNSSFASEYPQL